MGGVTLMTAGSPRPAPDCAKRPRERRPYHARPLAVLSDADLAGLSDADLMTLRDKVLKVVEARATAAVAVPPVVRKIILRVASDARVSPLDLMSRRRYAAIAKPRQVAMASVYAIRLPNGDRRFSYTMIGRYFRRDWTTVRHAVDVTPSAELVRP